MSVEKWLERHEATDEKRFDEINAKLDLLIQAHNKERGFIAGFSAAFSLLFASIVGLGIYIWQRHFGG